MTPERKGRISNEFTVWCGRCWEWKLVGGGVNRHAAATDARHARWKLTREHGWVCPADHEAGEGKKP